MRTRRSRAAPRGAGQWLLIALVAAGAIFTGWLVVRTSLLNLLLKDKPAVAARFAPGDPRLPLGAAMDELLTRGGVVRPQVRQAAFAAMQSAPLAEEPFVLAAVEALAKNDPARAQALLIEARRRKPRSSMTRLLLLDRYLRNNQLDEATVEMAALSGLVPRATDVLIGELARLARNPKTAAPLEQALRENPRFRDPLLEKLASDKADPDLILRLARSVPRAPGTSGTPAWQGKLVGSLVDDNQVGRAYALWRTFSAPKAPEEKAGIYDGGFQGLPGTGPFNWQFPASTAGVAERNEKRRLQVEYYGRDNAELASQLLMLAPGTYRLSFRVEGEAEGEGSRLSWKVACHPSKAELLDLGLVKVSYAPRVMSANFTVPSGGCQAQWLRLVGAAGEFAKAQHVEIGAIQLAAVR